MARSDDILIIEDDNRYSRLKMIGWWDQERLQNSRVIVVGAGALGNEVIKNLALIGVGQIMIIDFDRIETSNLSRAVLFRAEHCGRAKAEVAAEMAKHLNPDCHFNAKTWDVLQDVGLGLIQSADVVIGCVDNREARLWINRMCWRVNVPWIDGGIQEISGVVKTFVPPHGGCYECTMTENDYRLLQLRYSCPLLRREDMQQGKVPTAPTIASFVGALQTQEALKILHGKSVGTGVGLVFNGDANRFYQTEFPRRNSCLSHETFGEIISVRLSVQNSIEELFVGAESIHDTRANYLELDRDLLLQLVCDNCNEMTDVNAPLHRFTIDDATCTNCGEVRRTNSTSRIDRESVSRQLSLFQVGIPENDIVKIHFDDRVVWLGIAGDADAWTSGRGL